jgi:hypothetical protein
MAEHRFCKPTVVGSTPTLGSNPRARCCHPAGPEVTERPLPDGPNALVPCAPVARRVDDMQPVHVLLAQALSLSGLVAASGAYAGIVRRRSERRIEIQAVAHASQAAVTRVDRSMALSRIDRTFSAVASRRRGHPSAGTRER